MTLEFNTFQESIKLQLLIQSINTLYINEKQTNLIFILYTFLLLSISIKNLFFLSKNKNVQETSIKHKKIKMCNIHQLKISCFEIKGTDLSKY